MMETLKKYLPIAALGLAVGALVATGMAMRRLQEVSGYDRESAAIRHATVEACKPHDMVISEKKLDCELTVDGEIVLRGLNTKAQCSRCGIYSGGWLNMDGWSQESLREVAAAKTEDDLTQVKIKEWGVPDPEKKGKVEAHAPRRRA